MNAKFKKVTFSNGKFTNPTRLVLEVENGKTVELDFVPIELSTLRTAVNEAWESMWQGDRKDKKTD